MAILNILVKGNPVLKKKAKAVKKVTLTHVRLMDDMVETMRIAPGIGLAAPQVGVSERIIVVELENELFRLANPKIVKKSGKQVCMEGCLSVPGLEGPVERYKKICVTGMDKGGKQVKIDAEGLLAVVFQHEIDHLDGMLFVERVKDPSLIRPKEPTKEETI
ncbi:MAG: peptide deformylase [Candidatus Saganbacteria bacterium]|nr:peptide deformylase [Candidatus Saganbacteria bacterium]